MKVNNYNHRQPEATGWYKTTAMLRSLMVLLAIFLTQLAFGQIGGKVADENGKPMAGVSITVKNNKGAVTDVNGEFALNVKPGTAITISYIGYESQQVVIGSSKDLNIVLKPSSNVLSDVIVTTALGVKKNKDKLGFAVTEVKGETLAKTNELNPINALQGRVAGVQIDLGGSGGLMSNSKILIRGNSSLGTNNQPIFVVDGVIIDNDVFSGTGRDFGNDLKNLNSEDFESVSILKGSAAAALYGSRALNGVVLITTKKGKQRKGLGVSVTQAVNITNPYSGPTFQNEFGGGTVGDFFTDNRDPHYSANQRWTTKVFPIDPVTGKPYIDHQIGRELENWGPRMQGQDVINYDGTPTKYLPQPNNFLDAFQNGVGYNTNVAIDGGTEKSTFRFSYNRNKATGIVRTNEFLKNAFDIRVTHKLNKRIEIDFSGAYSNFDGQNPPNLGGGDAYASYNFGRLYTWMLPRNYDTKYWMQKQNYTSKFGGVPDPGNKSETNLSPESRFWFQVFESEFTRREQTLRSKLALTYTLNDWAKIMLEGNINNLYTKNESKELGQGANFTGGSYSLGFGTKDNKYAKWMFLVDRDINKDITFNGYIGGETQRSTIMGESSSTAGGLIYPGNYFLSNSVNTPTTSGGISSDMKTNSLYASADLGYKDMLFLQTTLRADWTSVLTYRNGSGNNFYQYPAASLAWVFTKTFENKLPSWISYGKLRGNIADLGKGNVNPFDINPGYSINGYSNANGNNVPYSTYNTSAVLQPNLKPLKKISQELGLEMRFLQSRLGFDLSVYKDNTYNQVLDITVPVESGVNAIKINAGNLQNRGIEFAIDAIPVRNKNFSWNTAFNIATNQNKIIDLYTGRTEFNLGANIGEISTWAVVGKSYGTLRTQIHSKTFQSNDPKDPRNGKPILAWRDDARTAFPKRSNTWQDVGDINAKFRAGWDNTFTYKNLSLNCLIDAKIGGDFVALSYRYGTHTGVFPNSIFGRDAQSGGITWTSKYANDGGTYDDGRIVDGVFDNGTVVTTPSGAKQDVSGMTFEEAYKAGFVEPTHTPQFFYRYGSSSTGVSDYWILENSWIALRQVALSYAVPQKFYSKMKLNGLSVSMVGRDLNYLYQTLPYNFNPGANNSNNTAYSGEEGFLPKMRNFVFTLRASF
ncbi:SusC/RagA family TonB-linked outer membrane protein [Chitinophagaceae bacterium LB-8]|uniref:SusC/RagA family TonB-linked outer membrane protein n=1 Tax=Paraflavisolibacter caeni TaxID=2982496 RepID=A0A9X3BGI2_9BACT|nr:SusC/RagA family TonB-linked outer membrane protein [Paraflavisolibacter caeni]MCU7550959.1 SusC/RagA family TonB-linked outer membrane protein [Paraflavisolibacter caeni]